MADYPYMPIWTDSWIACTRHLTLEQRGLYLELLVLIWRTPRCQIPNDDDWISNRIGLPLEVVKSILRPLISEFCQNDGNWIKSEKILHEFSRAKKLSRRNTVVAKSRWNKKKDMYQNDTTWYDFGNAPIPSPSPSEESKKDKDTPSAISANGSYVFECGLIKLNQKNFDQWQEAFSELDLRSELTALAGWDKLTRKGWFVAVANALAKKNREVLDRRAAIKIGIENGMKPPQKRYFRV